MIAAASRSSPSSPPRWLSVREASGLLGVTPSTLRHWANAGEVPSFRTPGGHRRFAEEDLTALIGGEDIPDSATSKLSDRAVARIRRRLVASPVAHGPWAQSLSEDEREQLRNMGRKLVALTSDYLTRRRGRTALADEARVIGEYYGATMARHRLALSHTLETFIFFRNLLEDTAQRLQDGAKSTVSQREEARRLLTGLLDQVLIGTVRGYEVAADNGAASSLGAR